MTDEPLIVPRVDSRWLGGEEVFTVCDVDLGYAFLRGAEGRERRVALSHFGTTYREVVDET